MDAANIGKNIKLLRVQLGLKQQDFADKTGIARSYLSRVESGLHLLGETKLQQVADFLGVSVQVLKSKNPFEKSESESTPNEILPEGLQELYSDKTLMNMLQLNEKEIEFIELVHTILTVPPTKEEYINYIAIVRNLSNNNKLNL